MEEQTFEEKIKQSKKDLIKVLIITSILLAALIGLFVFDQQTNWLASQAKNLLNLAVGK